MAKEKGYYLTEDGLEKIREVIRLVMGDPLNAKNRGPDRTIDGEEILPPEVYLIRTPTGGIPAVTANTTGSSQAAMEDDELGSAECSCYALDHATDPPTPYDLGLDLTVYNGSVNAVEGNVWALAIRDKAGNYWATPLGDPSSSTQDDCRYITVPGKICLNVTGSGSGTGTGLDRNTTYTLTVEYHIIDLKNRCEVISTYCVSGETDCCPEPEPEPAIDPGFIGCDALISNTYTITLECPDIPCLDGTSYTVTGLGNGIEWGGPITPRNCDSDYYLGAAGTDNISFDCQIDDYPTLAFGLWCLRASDDGITTPGPLTLVSAQLDPFRMEYTGIWYGPPSFFPSTTCTGEGLPITFVITQP